MKNMSKRMLKKIAVAGGFVLAGAQASFAALDATTLTEIQTGISSADSNYFAIGGSILVVLAGIWGFKLVKGLMR